MKIEVSKDGIHNPARGALVPPDPKQVATATAFLLLVRPCPIGHQAERSYSYALKHAAERWGAANGMEPYVTNGALIQAAVDLGIPVLPEGGRSPNAFIAVSRASMFRVLQDEVYAR